MNSIKLFRLKPISYLLLSVDDVDGEEEPDIDDFNRLRSIREQHRRDKYLQKLMARSVSAQQVIKKQY